MKKLAIAALVSVPVLLASILWLITSASKALYTLGYVLIAICCVIDLVFVVAMVIRAFSGKSLR